MTDTYLDEGDTGEDLDTSTTEEQGGAGEAEQPERQEQQEQQEQRRPGDATVALKAERAARRAEKREFQRQIDELRAAVQQPRQTEQRQTAAPINPEDDPIGALLETREKLAAIEAERQRATEQQGQAKAQEQYMARIQSTVQEYEAEFTADNPDYPQAAEFLTQSRSKEYQAAGYTPLQIQQALQREYHDIIVNAVNQGRDPAEIFYTLSKQRGFRGGSPSKLDAIAAGQKATGSMSGGGRGADGLTLGAVADLEGEDFDKAFSKLRAQARRREAGR